jgi:protein-S-isoprenylcysteine O-methyltransferase Ste14
MPLIEELETSGKWLFRWRSYFSLLMVLLMLASLGYYRYPYESVALHRLWELFCVLVGLFGVAIRGITAAYVPHKTSGRNTKRQIAESLNTTGMYSIVRNPLYLGNFFMVLSIGLYLHLWWIPVIYQLAFILYYERIVFAEEMYLRQRFGEEYLTWASRTPAFLPKLSQWQSPALPFSFRALLRREYQGSFGLILSLFLTDELTELYLGHGWRVDVMWVWIVGLATVLYVILRILHKKTDLLRVKGR